MEKNMQMQKDFTDYLNREVLFSCDFDRMTDKEYAKELLREMTDEFREIYGADELTEDMDFVLVPAVIKPQNVDRLYAGIVQLDLTSSGEHYATDMFTEYGVLSTDNEDLSLEAKQYLRSLHPYEYYPTLPNPGDIHVDWSKCPKEVSDIVDFCRSSVLEQDGGMTIE